MDSISAFTDDDDVFRGGIIYFISQSAGLMHVDSATWACLWLADISRLETIHDNLNESVQDPEPSILMDFSASRMLRIWAGLEVDDYDDEDGDNEEEETEAQDHRLQTRSDDSASPQRETGALKTDSAVSILTEHENDFETEPEPEHDGRLPLAEDVCMERDHHSCILTKARESIAVVSIYQESLVLPRPRSGTAGLHHQTTFWNPAKTLFNTEKFSQWEARLKSSQLTRTASTMLTLSIHAEVLWKQARFGLKPVDLSADRKTLTVQFHWFPYVAYSEEVPLTKKPYIEDGIGGPQEAILWDEVNDRNIISGDMITLVTEDPVRWPLPDVEVLRMQWDFGRLVALSGVGDVGYIE
ncbi:hypothetical protein BJX99DRAFT_259036 [Aspergillus californicus]